MEGIIALGILAGLLVMAFMFGTTGLSFLGALGAVATVAGILITFALIIGD